MKIFFANNDEVSTAVEIAPSKRAITKKYEQMGYEILKYVDISEQYEFTIEEVMANKLTKEQKELLAYILADYGVPANKEVEEDEDNSSED